MEDLKESILRQGKRSFARPIFPLGRPLPFGRTGPMTHNAKRSECRPLVLRPTRQALLLEDEPMPRFLQTVLLAAVAAFVLPACIINTEPRDTRDMRFLVSFEGLGCRGAGVDLVRITFESGAEGVQEVDCRGRGDLDVFFPSVPVGTVRVLFEAFDRGYTAYSGRFDLRHTHGGSRTYAIDLMPASEVVTYFTFAGLGDLDGMTCEEAQIVRLSLDVGGVAFDVPCHSDQQDAASLAGLEPGTYDTLVEAFDRDGRMLYASSFRLRVFHGSNEYILNILPLATAGLEFTWSFVDAPNCATAQVTDIWYQLVDAEGYLVHEGTVPCGGRDSTNSVLFSHTDPNGLEAGLYFLTVIEGIAGDGRTVRYRTEDAFLYAPAGRTQAFEVMLL